MAIRSVGLGSGDQVVLLERRGEVCVFHNALVINVSMRPETSGTQGEMAIDAAFVTRVADVRDTTLSIRGVVHVSHADWIERRAGMAYDSSTSGPSLLAVLEAQHQGLDRLMARLIPLDKTFLPSKSGFVWDALVAGNAAIQKLRMLQALTRGDSKLEAPCTP